MPVTIKPTELKACRYDVNSRRCRSGSQSIPVNLRGTVPKYVSSSAQLLEASLGFESEESTYFRALEGLDRGSTPSNEIYASSHNVKLNDQIYASINGLIQSAVDAYSGHHHLIIRPDDVWITILAQLSSYVTANAEELRHLLVSHGGVMELEIIDDNAMSIREIDYRRFLDAMPALMEKHVKDADIRAWIQQDFSTTTDVDRAVTSVIFMSAMQKYFEYTVSTRCGLPSVTLLGTRQDWEVLLAAIDKFTFFGAEPVEWRAVLRPVLQKFVESFHDPTSDAVIDFWRRMVHHDMGSGRDNITGWLTAFCYFDHKGKRVGRQWQEPASDGVIYRTLNVKDVPLGYVSVSLNINNTLESLNVKATMRAGCVGMAANGNENEPEIGAVQFDTIRPLVGWWIYDETPSEKLERKKEPKNYSGRAIAVMARKQASD